MTAVNTSLQHDVFFESLFKKEFNRVAENKHVYLDYTGGNLYAQTLLDKHFSLLSTNVLGNPHSSNPSSQKATQLVDEAREKVVSFFNASDYHCIFTQNASGALKIIGECYPFEQDGSFLLLADNHNSVNGIREYCQRKDGKFQYAKIQYEDLQINKELLSDLLTSSSPARNKLFAFPAQSNVSGVKHDLNWIKTAQANGWDVLLDAAAYVPTNSLDLKEIQPDYVSISFYKIFGYPTGLGCLFVKKSKFHKLIKPWFAGGTVTLVGVEAPYHYLAENHERFENGTINYLDIPAIKMGLDFMDQIGMDRLNERTTSCMAYLYTKLTELKHDNGKEVIKIFGPKERSKSGSNLILNIFDKNGHLIPFEFFEELANRKNISIRSGCFCNPGIDEINNCLTNDELSNYFLSRDKGDYEDMIAYLKKMRGATRVSVGMATRKYDLDVFISFVESFCNKQLEDLNFNQTLA